MPAPRRLLRLLAALFAITLLGAACGGDDDDSSSDDPTIGQDDGSSDEGALADGGEEEGGGGEVPNPCDLITLAEMETAFGFAWNEGEYAPPDVAPSATCTWSDADPGPPAKVVTLSVVTNDAAEEAFGLSAQEIHDSTKAAFEESDILEPDLGIGDDSYRTSGGIYVLDGDTSYSIITIGGVSDDAVAGFKTMAETVVGG